MQILKEHPSMWLYESVDEIDLKVNKALHRAKRSIMEYDAPKSPDLSNKVAINAAGQEAIAADLLSEKQFLKTLIDEGISGTMYSEESGVKTFGHPSVDDPRSIICLLDPLDGSANYMKGIPFGCISVAYGPYNPDPVLDDLQTGSIMSLYTNEEYFVEKGHGAYKNGNELKSFDDLALPDFEDRSIQLSYYAYGAKSSKYYFQFEDRYSLRSLGSAAWELALAAENRNDAFVDIRGVLKTHDFAAARLLLEEIGGIFEFLDLNDNEINEIPLNNFTSGYSVIGSIDTDLVDYLIDEFTKYELIAPTT